ncbi:MAG: hypothetical protein ACFFCE_17610 [Promethearchaeota archaeon]
MSFKKGMSKPTKWIYLIVILIYTNTFWIFDTVNSYRSGINLWIPIIFIVAQISIFLIYHYATKDYFSKKLEKQNKNPLL